MGLIYTIIAPLQCIQVCLYLNIGYLLYSIIAKILDVPKLNLHHNVHTHTHIHTHTHTHREGERDTER